MTMDEPSAQGPGRLGSQAAGVKVLAVRRAAGPARLVGQGLRVHLEVPAWAGRREPPK